MDKQDILGVSLLTVFAAILFFSGWWATSGADRSEYRFCVAEYMKSYPNDQKGSFNHCYDQTF